MTQCDYCGKRVEKDLRNMEIGLSVKCRCASAAVKYQDRRAAMLANRYQCMVQRCERETHKCHRNYKGRGIKVLFKSCEDFVRWALEKWPDESFKKLEFDRIDNNGHYSPENLRLVTSSVNKMNTRRSANRMRAFNLKTNNPNLGYSFTTCYNMIMKGMSDEDILSQFEKNKNRVGKKSGKVNPAFAYMTSLMQDREDGSPVQGC